MVENLENEQWLSIEGYEELYQVSNYGRVKSLERIDNLGRTVKEKILKQKTTKKGYQRVKLCKDGKEKMFFVHRLVAMAFISNSNNYEQVNHKDENKCNNHVDNLEWCDCKYNINYGSWIEKHSGENNHLSKQVIQLTLGGEVIRNWDCIADVKRELGFNHAHICSCCRNKRKSAYKYKWCYA